MSPCIIISTPLLMKSLVKPPLRNYKMWNVPPYTRWTTWKKQSFVANCLPLYEKISENTFCYVPQNNILLWTIALTLSSNPSISYTIFHSVYQYNLTWFISTVGLSGVSVEASVNIISNHEWTVMSDSVSSVSYECLVTWVLACVGEAAVCLTYRGIHSSPPLHPWTLATLVVLLLGNSSCLK